MEMSAQPLENRNRSWRRCGSDTHTVIGNARQRRSAARSAQRHAARQRLIRSRVLAVLFVLKLQRRVRLRRELEELEELEDAGHLGDAAKRGRPSSRSDILSSSASSSSCDPQDLEHHHIMGVVKTSTRVSHLAKRFSGGTGPPLLR